MELVERFSSFFSRHLSLSLPSFVRFVALFFFFTWYYILPSAASSFPIITLYHGYRLSYSLYRPGAPEGKFDIRLVRVFIVPLVLDSHSPLLSRLNVLSGSPIHGTLSSSRNHHIPTLENFIPYCTALEYCTLSSYIGVSKTSLSISNASNP